MKKSTVSLLGFKTPAKNKTLKEPPVTTKWQRHAGQTTTETILLFPFYMVLVFGLLQLGQLGVALLVANYAASSIARQAVEDNISGSVEYTSKMEKLMTAGMRRPYAKATAEFSTPPFAEVSADACAEVYAYPFIGQLLGKAITKGLASGNSSKCTTLSTFAYSNSRPAYFVVHGKASARMNYKP